MLLRRPLVSRGLPQPRFSDARFTTSDEGMDAKDGFDGGFGVERFGADQIEQEFQRCILARESDGGKQNRTPPRIVRPWRSIPATPSKPSGECVPAIARAASAALSSAAARKRPTHGMAAHDLQCAGCRCSRRRALRVRRRPRTALRRSKSDGRRRAYLLDRAHHLRCEPTCLCRPAVRRRCASKSASLRLRHCTSARAQVARRVPAVSDRPPQTGSIWMCRMPRRKTSAS